MRCWVSCAGYLILHIEHIIYIIKKFYQDLPDGADGFYLCLRFCYCFYPSDLMLALRMPELLVSVSVDIGFWPLVHHLQDINHQPFGS